MLKRSSSIMVTWCKQPTHWKSPWCSETLRAEGEEGDRGLDGWMVSPIQWAWTWANSRRRWGLGRPDVLQSLGSQRVRQDWANEQQQQRIEILPELGPLEIWPWSLSDLLLYSSLSEPYDPPNYSYFTWRELVKLYALWIANYTT